MDTEKIEEICEDLVGTVCSSFAENFEVEFDRKPTAKEVAYAQKYMAIAGISECDCCGWYQNDNDGLEGNLCWRCAEDEDSNGADEDEEF